MVPWVQLKKYLIHDHFPEIYISYQGTLGIYGHVTLSNIHTVSFIRDDVNFA